MIFQEILNVRLFLEISLQLQLYSQALLANSACDMQKKKKQTLSDNFSNFARYLTKYQECMSEKVA